MRRFGFTNLLRLARQSAPTGATLAPHNWGSYLGGFMQAVLGRGIPNFCIAELDPGQTDVFDASAFKIHDGQVKVPDTPGCGLELREAKFADLELKWDVTA
jgi:L-alanine-DL-glutamate epimerase-like enolase superfamily enzyme